MEFLVYLAGPVAGTTVEECLAWRKYVRDRLPPNIITLSPVRQYELKTDKTGHVLGFDRTYILAQSKGITRRDRFDVMRADLVLFNLIGAKKVSIGTMIEIGWADALQKPTIIAMEPGNVHEHDMVQETGGWIVPTLDEAIKVVQAIILPHDEPA